MDETFGGKEYRNELYEAVMKLVKELGGTAANGGVTLRRNRPSGARFLGARV